MKSCALGWVLFEDGSYIPFENKEELNNIIKKCKSNNEYYEIEDNPQYY